MKESKGPKYFNSLDGRVVVIRRGWVDRHGRRSEESAFGSNGPELYIEAGRSPAVQHSHQQSLAHSCFDGHVLTSTETRDKRAEISLSLLKNPDEWTCTCFRLRHPGVVFYT